MEKVVDGNIFCFRKGDGIAYLVLYIFIPVVITTLSLFVLPTDEVAGVYCYITILVSALNCLYDAGLRWISGEKTSKNKKLFWIMLLVAIVVGYCMVVIFGTLIMKQGLWRVCDWILLAYLGANVVALTDIVGCFSMDIAWKKCVNGVGLEGGDK